jgi:hypothetical protein
MTDLISKGRHAAVPRSIQFGYAGEDNKPQAAVAFEIVGETDPFAGWTITAFLFLHDNSRERSIESFRYMGWTGDDLVELPALCEAGQLGEVDIVVDHEEYQEKLQAKVKWVNRRGGGGVQLKKPMEGTALADFAMRMKGRIRTMGAAGGQRNAGGGQRTFGGNGASSRGTAAHPNAPGNSWGSAPPAGAAAGTDDDIPF